MFFPVSGPSFVVLSSLFIVYCVAADELLSGSAQGENDAVLHFSLSGNSREDVIGGKIRFGDKTFTIQKISVRGLIGADRSDPAVAEGGFAEYAIFSSSYSDQTAVGQPWVASKAYRDCDIAYNSFLALYRIDDRQAAEALGTLPYPVLTEQVDVADDSTVYCFSTRPPEKP